MCICDYRGWRLLAASLLPLGSQTLVYGSSDGGHSIHTSSPVMNAKVELVAKMLNLGGEYVWNRPKTKKAMLYLSCDIEGHLGKDGRYYLLDTARLFPPTAPRPGKLNCRSDILSFAQFIIYLSMSQYIYFSI